MTETILTLQNTNEVTGGRHFDPWRLPASDAARAVIADILNQVQNYEEYYGLRERKRRPKDQETFEATVTAIICDLIHAELMRDRRGILISRSKRVITKKGNPPALNKKLPEILDSLSSPEMAFVTQVKGHQRSFRGNQLTVITCGTRLLTRIRNHKLTLSDLKRESHGEEVLVLKDNKPHPTAQAPQLKVPDNDFTRTARQQLREINGWLHQADISVDTSALDLPRPIDPGQRFMVRIFNRGSLKSGGRLEGGFWLPMSRRDRLKAIQIEGEEVTILDYGQTALRIACGLAGVETRPGDLYAVPGLEGNREGVKKVINALFFSTKPLNRKPQGTAKLLPKKMKITQIVDLVKETHPVVSHLMEKGQGHYLQFLESELLVSLLLRLKEEGIVSLPVHEAVVVPRSKKSRCEEIMKEVFKKNVGVEATVKEERLEELKAA
jgi:hypothetical protein